MFFFSIILFIGVLTIFTDLREKKIYTYHLAIGAILGFIAVIHAALFKHENISSQIVNGIAAFLVGIIMHRGTLWKGGDAKLFTLYAFLMPPPAFSHMPFFSITNLFACSFLSGMIILMPAFIKDIIINHQAIVRNMFSPERRRSLHMSILTVLFFSWILFPVFYCAQITNPLIILMIIFLLFSWRYNMRREFPIKFSTKDYTIFALGFIFGVLTRLLLSPDSLSFPTLMRHIIIITLSTAISICIHSIFNHLENYHDRVPFAPLLFMGCILSYTPFLTWIVHLMPK